MAGRRTVKGSLIDDRGIWTVRARVYDPNSGKVRQRVKSLGLRVKDNTKRRAQDAMKIIVQQWEAEANAAPAKREPFFSEYVEKWLERKESTRRANTALSYRQYAELHICPALGQYRVCDITRQQLQEYCNQKLKVLSVSSTKKQFIIIRGALTDAVLDDVIASNPAQYVEFPETKKFEGKAYTPEQVSALLDAAAQEGEPIRAALMLAVVYGLRRSEICGLRWKDIDFDGGKLYVRNTRTQNGTLVIEAEQTKTKKSRRTIDLIESTVPYLQELKQTQEQSGLTPGKVCVWPDGQIVRPDFITRRTGQIMKKYGLERVRLHDLRHTAITLLLAAGATPKQAQGFAGHSDIDMTMNVYGHLLEADRKATSAIMDDILKKSVFCSGKCSGR